MSEVLTVSGLVLHKTDYSENSVIASVLTEQNGLVKFIIKGDRRVSKKHLPQVDVMRRLSLTFKYKENYELQMPTSVERIGGFENIVKNYKNYCLALWFCRFLERNLHPFHPIIGLPELLNKTLRFLEEQGDESARLSVFSSFVLGFLVYEGLLDESYFVEIAPHLKPFYDFVVDEKVNSFPKINVDDLRKLADWANQFLIQQHFHLPELSFI